MNITFSPTPFGTVHVETVAPVQDASKAKRKISAQVSPRGLGKRLSLREHRFGSYVKIGAIYRKH